MNRRRVAPLLLLAVAAALAIGYWLSRPAAPENRLLASGTVEATDALLGFQTSGLITAVHPREGEAVEAGEILATLDRDEIDARRVEAEGMLAAAEARLADLRAGYRSEEIAQARAGVAAARDRLADAERDLERSRVLLEGGAVPREALDKSELARELAAAGLDQAREQLELLERGHRPQQIEVARAQVEGARAALGVLDARLAQATLAAPFGGVVTVRHREPGEVVAPGAPVLTLLDREDRWVRIYVREDRVGAVHLGQSARIHSDTYPEKSHRGEVVFISPEAEFTPKDVQTREERVRLVYAVKVRIFEDPGDELKPGMPVDVELLLAGGEG